LEEHFPSFIEADIWPPNSPELNPVDYFVWGAMVEKVYRHQIRDLEHLRAEITQAWAEIPQRALQRAVDQWRRRLAAVVNSEGGTIVLVNAEKGAFFTVKSLLFYLNFFFH
jgi:inhibitor of nuclear factor kappa-B kinase subunit alpha